jgi:hypothetical protein
MSRWTLQQVAKLAPDDGSMAAARKLAHPGPWSSTGSTDLLLWGECQGSGKKPYQVSVDLTGSPAYRCSCPSRKIPCKHVLALLLLWGQGGDSVAEVGEAGGFAAEWATGRAERSAARDARAEAASPPDPAAQAKRREARLALMDEGVADFASWLTDVVRTGFASARQQPASWWDQAAARLVDAQLPGLADQVRAEGSEVHRRADWADHLLATCGRWWTLTETWQRRADLDLVTMAELRAAVGWSTTTAEAREQDADAAPASWTVLGAHRSEDGRLQQQRTWLRRADTGEVVQVLDFAAAGAALGTPQLAGTLLETTMVRYPGAAPRRGLFVGDPVAVGSVEHLADGTTIAGAHERLAERVAAVPWSDRVPVTLASVTVVPGSRAVVQDREGHCLPLVAGAPIWAMLALSGSAPADLFGELEAGALRPLSLVAAGQVVAL